MQEYIVTVEFDDGTEEDIKSWGKSISDVIDNMVLLPIVKDMIQVIRKEDNETWYLKGTLEPIRKFKQSLELEHGVDVTVGYGRGTNNGK